MSAIPAGFFMPLTNSHPFLKLSVFGELSTGKSTLLAKIAAGLARKLARPQPVALLGTERAASDLLPIFEVAGVEVLHRETREVADLLETMKMARTGAFSIVLIDSFTHFWESWLELCKGQLGVTTRPLSPTEKGDIKTEWRKRVAAPLVDDPVHYLCSLRASADYESELDQDTLRRESHQVGLRMRSEADTGYESNVVVRMERRELREIRPNGKARIRVVRQAIVEKDRTATVDGKALDPEWVSFEPVVDKILARGGARATAKLVEPSVFHGPGSVGRERERATRKALLLEEIDSWLESSFPGRSAQVVKERNEVVVCVFGTLAPSFPKGLGLEVLEEKHANLRRVLIDAKHNAPSALIDEFKRPAEAPLVPGETLAERLGVPDDIFETPANFPVGAGAALDNPQQGPAPAPSPEARTVPASTNANVTKQTPAGAVTQTTGPADPVDKCRGGPLDGAHMGEECPNESEADELARHERELTEAIAAERAAGTEVIASIPENPKEDIGFNEASLTRPSIDPTPTPAHGTVTSSGPFLLEDGLARLGHGQGRHVAELMAVPDNESSGNLCSAILTLAERQHGRMAVGQLWQQVGGQLTGGIKPRREPLTGAQLRRLVLLLPVKFLPAREVNAVSPVGSANRTGTPDGPATGEPANPLGEALSELGTSGIKW